MQTLSRFLILFTIIIISACSNPMNRKYSNDNLERDLKEIKETKKMDSLESVIFAQYLVIKKISNDDILKDKTYSDILKEAKEFRDKRDKEEAEKKEKEALKKKEAEDKFNKIRNALNVTIINKKMVSSYYGIFKQIEMTFVFENKTEKDIRAFKGSFVINDLFETLIRRVGLTYDKGVKANETKSVNLYIDYNEFMNEDVKLKNTEIENIVGIWEPVKIIFKDGNILE